MPRPTEDLTGRSFGKLTVLKKAPPIAPKKYNTRWVCSCSCGKVKEVYASNLLQGFSTSCGCGRGKPVHGMSGTREYGLLAHARERAKKLGIDCTLQIEDIHIPATCPVLGIPLEHGKGKLGDRSPTIDRVDIRKAYTPDNIEIVSLLANRIKNSSYSSEQVRAVADWMQSRGL